MKERVGVTAWPLYWPLGWERTKYPSHSAFSETNVYVQATFVREELARLHAKNVVISSNLKLRQDGLPLSSQSIPKDVGVAVWFWLPKKGVGRYTEVTEKNWTEHVLACDKWAKAEHNLRAIGLHVQAIRGQARWGVGSIEQAFGGFTALPERAESSVRAWETLGIPREGATFEKVQTAFKRAARTAHPDVGGTREAWDQLCAARDAALLEVRA